MKAPMYSFKLFGCMLFVSSVKDGLVSAHGHHVHDHDHHGHGHNHHHHHHHSRRLRGLMPNIPEGGNGNGHNPWEGKDFCATPKPNKDDDNRAAIAMEKWNNQPNKNKHNRHLQTITVPTYIHKIYPRTPSENEVHNNEQAQIDVLNAAYPGYYFDLVEVTATKNRHWWDISMGSGQEDSMKAALRRGGPDALNIYYINPPEFLGWGTFPWRYPGNPSDDGVVCLHSTGVGGSSAPYNLGDTLVHEVGHWMGLYHTFEGGSCFGPGDGVADTNFERSPSYGCPVGKESCGSEDPISNYMNYADDSCMNEFTPLQRDRMDAMWTEYRRSSSSPTPATPSPTKEPSSSPSKKPMPDPTSSPTSKPTRSPTTSSPTDAPTVPVPTKSPFSQPTDSPTKKPTPSPTPPTPKPVTACAGKFAPAPNGCPSSGLTPTSECCSGQCFTNGGNRGMCK